MVSESIAEPIETGTREESSTEALPGIGAPTRNPVLPDQEAAISVPELKTVIRLQKRIQDASFHAYARK